MNALSSIVQFVVVGFSYCADVLPPRHRTAGFGLVVASFATGFMIGPAIGSHLEPLVAATVMVGCALSAIFVIVVAIPESLPPSVAEASGGYEERTVCLAK